MIRRTNAERLRAVALTAALLAVCVPGVRGQHRGGESSGRAPHFSDRRPQPAAPGREQGRGWQQNQRPAGRPEAGQPYDGGRPQQSGPRYAPYGQPYRVPYGQQPMPYAGQRNGFAEPLRSVPSERPDGYRPAYRAEGAQQGRPEYRGGRGNNSRPGSYDNNAGAGPNHGSQGVRPRYNPGPRLNEGSQAGRANENNGTPGSRPGPASPVMPPGHLGSWLTQHRDLPLQKQEQLLRGDPSFSRLPAADQQRLMSQLRAVNQMPAQQRDRRLERAEAIERLSPQDRAHLSQTSRSYKALPPDRQALVKRAFQDLRGVPLDQRQTVLNSARYQGVFTPQERGILSDFLRVEPYEPQQ